MKYRKKPVVVEAIQFTRDNIDECIKFTNYGLDEVMIEYGQVVEGDLIKGVRSGIMTGQIKTLENGHGAHAVNEGDYIIKGVKGEFYPCKPDIFKVTYEKSGDKDE